MNRLAQLMESRKEKLDAIDAILQKSYDEKRSMTEAEDADCKKLEGEIKDLDSRIDREERVTAMKSASKEIINPMPKAEAPAIIGRAKNDEEFENFGEFLHAACYNKRDKRLENCEYREQSVSDPSSGGFLVPKQFMDTLMQVAPQGAIVRPRASVIAAGTPPDASIGIPALDQSTAQNIYGGMSVSWINEGDAKPETTAKLREITLTPQEVAGHVIVTDKLLRNAPAMSSLLTRMLSACITGAEDTAFMSGNGVGKPLGVLNSPALIKYNRATANQIAFADVTGMLARIKYGGSLVWIASQTIIPQLVNLRDTGNNNLWVTAQAGFSTQGIPGTLAGIPLVYAERSPVLGSLGDLMLVDLSYYLVKDGSGPFIGMSEHVYFTNNKTVIKAFWNVDGQPWLNTPILLEGSTTQTVSPFVALDVP